MAQSGAAESNTLEQILATLAEFEPVELPFISLYLNAQANEHGRKDFDRFLRKEFGERAKTFPASSPERESFERDAERIREYLDKEVRPETQGIAVFVFGRGKTLQADEVQNVKTKGSKVGGWSQMRYQRHLENYHLHHAKEVADQ